MKNSNKIFGAHEKLFWSIQKLDYARRKMGRSFGRSRKKFREVLRDRLMDDKPKG
jgi:hypothetical protein